jgi:hypothetical protein
LTPAQLPNIALAFSGNARVWSLDQNNTTRGIANIDINVAGGPIPMDQNGSNFQPSVTVTPDGTVTAGGSTNLGSGNSFPTMPPAVSLMKILRVI